MNLWLLACLVGCFVAAWSPDVRAQGVFGDCCLSYDKQGLQQKLRFAQNYKLQEVSGSCNLRAVIFFFPQKRKPLCGNPRNRLVKKAMKCMDAQRKSLHKCLRDHSVKGRPGISGQFLSNSNHLISGKKKAHFPIVNPGDWSALGGGSYREDASRYNTLAPTSDRQPGLQLSGSL